jgi:hypothetical protein
MAAPAKATKTITAAITRLHEKCDCRLGSCKSAGVLSGGGQLPPTEIVRPSGGAWRRSGRVSKGVRELLTCPAPQFRRRDKHELRANRL